MEDLQHLPALVAWASHLVGGFLFGFGMTLASGCGSKLLVRAGGGSLKSLVTLVVLAIAAYMTLEGLFAVWRVNTLDTLRLDTSSFGAAHSYAGTIAAVERSVANRDFRRRGVLGMAVGSAAVALVTRTFRWEGFASTEDLVNHIVGGVLMGFGGVTALGCTIGQGVTGISTLALGSFIALAAIIAGCAVALTYQYWRAG